MKNINKFSLLWLLILLSSAQWANAQLFGGMPIHKVAAACPSTTTTIVDVTAAGYVWMDRNLGASQAATSSTDAASYGVLFQWGRACDGHQVRTSALYSSGLASTAVPNGGNAWDARFITNSVSPVDWLTTQDNTLWQGVNGTNNPCPAGYRLPTEVEFQALINSFSPNSSAGAFASPVKIPMAGYRDHSTGNLANVGFGGYYWCSTVGGTGARTLNIGGSPSNIDSDNRAFGESVRCIKEATGTVTALNCAGARNIGALTSGTAASGVSSRLPYTGGNGGLYYAFSVASTGVTGLTASIAAGTFATGADSLTVTITGTPASSGTASFVITIGGHSCTLTRTVAAASPPATSCSGGGYAPASFPLTLNGSTASVSYNGTFASFSPFLNCGLTAVAGTHFWHGSSGNFTTATFTYSGLPVNVVEVTIGAQDITEVFTVTTSAGTPTITYVGGSCASCYTISGGTVTVNSVTCGSGSYISGRFRIYNATSFTTMGITHSGTLNGMIWEYNCHD